MTTGLLDDLERREALALGCQILASKGHDDYVWGHASVRASEGDAFWLKGSGLGLSEVTADDMVLVDFGGNVLQGERPRHAEWPIHAEILKSVPGAQSVVHTHPPHSIALGSTNLPLLALSHAGTLFIPPGVPRFTLTPDLILTTQLGRELAQTLGDAPAAFLVNHGIVTVGSSIVEAVGRAVLLEDASYQQLLALQAGVPLTSPTEEQALAKRPHVWSPGQIEQLWNYLAHHLS